MQLSRLTKVNVTAASDLESTPGIERGILRDSTKPRIVLVRICEASRSNRSRSERHERKRSSGAIMYEFHRNDGSKLSISKLVLSIDLETGVSPKIHAGLPQHKVKLRRKDVL